MRKHYLLLLLFVLITGCVTKDSAPPSSPVAKPLFLLRPATFNDFPSWNRVDFQNSFTAFQKSCQGIYKRSYNKPVAQSQYFGNAQDWQNICVSQYSYAPYQAKSFFETYFRPVEIVNQDKNDTGMFTGYYEPIVRGSFYRTGAFQYPLYAPPVGLTKPYPQRASIVSGALNNYAKPIIWLDSEIDSFFLHIQGSGRAVLPDGRMVKLAYADQNGHPYYAIGKYLIETGAIEKSQMSARAIKIWLRDNPQQAQNVMNKNPSYVFFKINADASDVSAVGAAGVPLTPEYSLAVDKNIYPYGVPLWIETEVIVPYHEKFGQKMAFHRLMIAQDTGGAIKGAVRGDVFFGTGEHAEFMASHLTSGGKKYILLPKNPH